MAKAVKNIGASVRARLLNLSRANGQSFDLVLTRFALERLLYRLGRSRHADRFVLKGAMLRMSWFEEPHRGTHDLHWFTGTAAEARRGIRLGCYFSVNERMLNSPNGRRVLREIPDGRLLTETDGPFVERPGEPIGPGDVSGALGEAAALKGTGVQALQKQVVRNLRDLLAPTMCGEGKDAGTI